jgi:hypothetical protein
MSAIGEWIWQKGVAKGVGIVVKAFASYLIALGITDKFGITINVEVMSLGVLGLLEIGRNFLKVKLPKIFGWL